MPVPNHRVEGRECFVRRLAGGVGADTQADNGQEGRVRRFGQQRGGQVQTEVGGGYPQVQQGRAAADMESAGGGVGLWHRTVEVRTEHEGAAGAFVAEEPGLGVVHGRCGGGIGD